MPSCKLTNLFILNKLNEKTVILPTVMVSVFYGDGRTIFLFTPLELGKITVIIDCAHPFSIDHGSIYE